MERSEKRRLERERQKYGKQNIKEDAVNKQWFSQLPVSRKIFIGKFIESRAIENDNLVAAIMDKCFMNAIDDNTDIDIKLMSKIIKEGNDYILGYKDFLDKYGDGGFDMIENVKLRDEVKDKMLRFIECGNTKVKAMAILKKEYSLPAAELSDLWVKCKEEISKIEVDGSNVISDKLETAINGIESPEVKPETIKTNLEVIDEIKVVKGKFGFYHKGNDGLRFRDCSKSVDPTDDEIIYHSKTDLIAQRSLRISNFDEEILALKEKLEILENDRSIYLEASEEIEQVFDI